MYNDFLERKLVLTRNNEENAKRIYTRIPIDFSIPKYFNTATKKG
jgi:hypothetical protein